MENNNAQQTVLKISAGLLIFSGVFLALCSLIISKDPGDFVSKTMVISFFALFYGIMAALSFSIFKKNRLQALALVGIITAVLGFLLASLAVLFEIENKLYYKSLFSFSILSIAMAQINMLYKIDIVNKWAAVSRIIAVAAIAIFSFMLIILFFNSFDEIENFMDMPRVANTVGRAYTALLAIDLAFTAATPLLNKLEAGKYEEQVNLEEDFLKDLEPAE